ncbi:MAG: hypothetical protein ACE361_04735 [Aureliella sp.]
MSIHAAGPFGTVVATSLICRNTIKINKEYTMKYWLLGSALLLGFLFA